MTSAIILWITDWPPLLAAFLVWLVPWLLVRIHGWLSRRGDQPWKREQP